MLQSLILRCCRLYNVFGSGANHAIYAQLIGQSSTIHGRKVGLLRGASTRMASFFYCMLRVLRLKTALRATIHQPKFLSLKKNAKIEGAVFDIQSDNFFKALYTLVRAVYPALLLLRACDKNDPFMDKIYYYVNLCTEGLNKSLPDLNNVVLFPGDVRDDEEDLVEEEAEVFGTPDTEEEPE